MPFNFLASPQMHLMHIAYFTLTEGSHINQTVLLTAPLMNLFPLLCLAWNKALLQLQGMSSWFIPKFTIMAQRDVSHRLFTQNTFLLSDWPLFEFLLTIFHLCSVFLYLLDQGCCGFLNIFPFSQGMSIKVLFTILIQCTFSQIQQIAPYGPLAICSVCVCSKKNQIFCKCETKKSGFDRTQSNQHVARERRVYLDCTEIKI